MMKKFIVSLVVVLLAGCSTFKVGSVVYCHSNADCEFKQVAK